MTAEDPAPAPTLLERVRPLIPRYLPITVWARSYPKAWLRPDLLAALTSWVVMVPVALAYAGLAGVPPELGLTTAFAAMTAYAVFGTSRHLKVTVSSTMAIMSAAVVVDLARGDPSLVVVLTSALALTVGILLTAGGIARLGFIADFLTKSVVTGFIFGLAITILVGQLPKILGVPSSSGSVPEQLRQLIAELPETNLWTLAVGLSALVLILVLRTISRKIPGALIALVLGLVAVPLLNLESRGVTVVGDIATGLPSLSIPVPPVSAIPLLIVGAVGIVFLAVGESVGAARGFATRHRYEIDADQELFALGAANVASGLFGGFTADASLSQTATSESAGARSQLSSLVTAGLVLATAVFLAPVFANLPNAVLGAIVIAAVIGLMDVTEMRRYWRWRRTDFLTAMVALVGVVLTTVLTGLAIAVLLSVAFLLYRASRPYVAALGRIPGYRSTFGDLTRHPDAEPIPGLLVVRLDAPLYFFNANVARTQILALVTAADPPPQGILIDMAATADLDVTTTDMLYELVADLEERSIEVLLAQVKGSVRDRLRRTGLMDRIGEDRLYLSLGSAVTDFGRRWPTEPPPLPVASAAESPEESPGSRLPELTRSRPIALRADPSEATLRPLAGLPFGRSTTPGRRGCGSEVEPVVKNPPILISVLGFFGLMAGLYYIYAGLRIWGFNFFGIFATAPVTGGWGFWGLLWIVVGLIYFAASWALWSLQPWAWLFGVILSVFALISAFFVMFDSGIGPALGAAILPGIILLYLNSAEVRKAFDIDGTAGGV